MKNIVFIFLFVLGVGVALLGNRYFKNDFGNNAANPLSGDHCTMACCLPYEGELSDSQQKALISMEKNYCVCRDRLSREIDKRRLALADMLLHQEPDITLIDNLIAETANLQVELEKETIRHILDIKAQLGPRDRERFVKPIVEEVRKRCFHQHHSKALSSGPSR